MATVIDNPYLATPPQRAGLLFELQVLDALKTGLPDDFYVMHSIVLTQRGKYDRGLGREVDFIVVGPPGVFVIEAKLKDAVEGEFFGRWTFRRYLNGRVRSQSTTSSSPGHILRCKIQETCPILRQKEMPEICSDWQPHAIRGIFVFPDHADIKIYSNPNSTTPETSFRRGQYFVTSLSTISATLAELRPFRDGPELSAQQARAIITQFRPGRYIDPKIAGDYEIVEKLSEHRALNGIRYTLYKLEHRSLGYARLGKLYDITSLTHENSAFFNEQINRHAKTLIKLKEHNNVLRFMALKVDEIREGIWVLMDWVDADLLETFLEKSPQDTNTLKKIAYELALALEHLHTKKMVRRTLNPDAIMIERDTNRTLLTNFEITKQLDSTNTIFEDISAVKTDPYNAPELEKNRHNGDVRLDVYGWGAIVHRIFTGEAPNRNGINEKVDFKIDLPDKIANCISQCLSLSANDRPKNMKAITNVIADWEML